jgi:hypothetical protein
MLMEEPKNTAERKKVENVGRPEDKKPDDSDSKLAKQAEIKTKIIDEDSLGYESKASKNKPNEVDKKDAKEIKGGKTEINLDPKTDDKVGDESDETEKSKKARDKVNKESGAKGAGDVKEESLDEKNWIAGAIKKPGALHKQLHVPADEKIPAGKLNAAAEKGGKLGQRARLAKTLKRIVKGK